MGQLLSLQTTTAIQTKYINIMLLWMIVYCLRYVDDTRNEKERKKVVITLVNKKENNKIYIVANVERRKIN